MMQRSITALFLLAFFFSVSYTSSAQGNTQIRGFVHANATYTPVNKLSFGLGEQDLFITSDLSDRLFFLGETVFKFDPASPTKFSVSIERIVLKYNIKGNHNILIGKHHTPVNYWNDTYHHGRVFFPTIDRPLLFSTEIFPLHTTGISLQGLNLGRLKFGYDVMLGNGLGSSDILDNDKHKSVTVAMHVKPYRALRLGASLYHDVISKGAELHNHHAMGWHLKEDLVTVSVANFGKKFELLTESMVGFTRTDSTGTRRSVSSYLYAGYKATDTVTPYIRVDNLHYQTGELGFSKNNANSYVVGLRYQINYLAIVKLEYQHQNSEKQPDVNKIATQIAIGF